MSKEYHFELLNFEDTQRAGSVVRFFEGGCYESFSRVDHWSSKKESNS